MSSFPIIDLANLDKPTSQLGIAEQITEASSTWGFLLLKNHQIPEKDIQEIFALGRDFFINEPESEKTPWPINSRYVGYNGALCDRRKDDKASIWLSGKPGFLADEGFEALPPYWRDKIDKVEAFKHKCHGLVIKLLVCFALAMKLPDKHYFAHAHAEDVGNGNQFRMLCYPARTSEPSDTTTRMSPHSDSGSVTLLFQTCAGLEVEAPAGEGKWVAAPHIDGHILVNLGDALAFWSGTRLKATKHRVTFDGVPHDIERLSMAYFGAASPDTVLQPLDGAGGVQPLDKYQANGMTIPAGITVGEYSTMIMKNIYGAGMSTASAGSGAKYVIEAAA